MTGILTRNAALAHARQAGRGSERDLEQLLEAVVRNQLHGTHELTASGAVNPGAGAVELNHATVLIAATIADAADHAGMFYAVNTSASGVVAHTITLTNGTWNGTNKVATFDAPAESLLVFFNTNGDGRIILNTGAVALSG